MPKYFRDSFGLVRARDVLSNPDHIAQFAAVSDYPVGTKEMLLCGRKKDETRGWELLPGMPSVESVMAYQPREEHLELLAQMPNLRRLGLLDPKLPDFSVLAAGKRLEVVFVECAANLSELRSFANLRHLRALGIFDAKRLKDLSGLESIPRLEELAIQCGITSALKVKTLQPLASLTTLKVLYLHADCDDGSFEPLRHLTSLDELSLNLQCPYSEMAKLAAFISEQVCPYLGEPFAKTNTCPQDASHDLLIPARGWRKFCKDCHPKKLGEYLAEFARIREDSRRRGAW